MADDDLRFQLELLNQLTDPVPENNLSRIFNTHNTGNTGTIPGISNNVTDNNTFFIDQSSLFSPTPINIPTNPITGNVVPAMILTPPISLPAAYPTYPTTYYNVAFPPIQDPAILTAPAVEEQHPEPNWEAINAFLRGQVRPGADVERLYTCYVCNAEYANAQALGGHMGMHRRTKNLRGEGSSSKSTNPSKKPRRR